MKLHRTPALAIAVFLSLLAIAPARAATILTKSYRITVTENCDEDVACRDVSFTAQRLATGKIVRLKGRAVTSLCKDGITPCHHQGYQFDDGNTSYFVSDGDWLEISLNGKVVLHEVFLSYERDQAA